MPVHGDDPSEIMDAFRTAVCLQTGGHRYGKDTVTCVRCDYCTDIFIQLYYTDVFEHAFSTAHNL